MQTVSRFIALIISAVIGLFLGASLVPAVLTALNAGSPDGSLQFYGMFCGGVIGALFGPMIYLRVQKSLERGEK